MLQVAQQPEALLGLRVKRRKRAGIEQWLGSVEQRCEQCCELDHGLAWIGSAAADSDAEAASDRRGLGEEDCFSPVGKPFELAPNQREFRVASMEVPHWNRLHPLLPASISQALSAFSNRRIV